MRHNLLERAAGYALKAVGGVGGVGGVTPELSRHPTPCRGWDLRMLITHADESLTALQEGICAGAIALIGTAPAPGLASASCADLAAAFCDRVTRLLQVSCVCADTPDRVVTIAGLPITVGTLTAVAALEIAVHGWDVSQACGQCVPIPPALATDLLELSALLVPRAGRHPMFAEPVPVAPTASPSDRLIAFLGRHPLGAGTAR
jgi:uncharacterized protein (TIGR03086 family)